MSEAALPHGERRGIPIEVINYINSAIGSGFESATLTMMTKDEFVKHDKAELLRYDTIIKSQHTNELASIDRHNELVGKINTFMGVQEKINTAFLKDHNGDPDYHGHNFDHYARAKSAKSWKEFWGDTFKKLATGAIYSGSVVVGLILWEAFKVSVQK